MARCKVKKQQLSKENMRKVVEAERNNKLQCLAAFER